MATTRGGRTSGGVPTPVHPVRAPGVCCPGPVGAFGFVVADRCHAPGRPHRPRDGGGTLPVGPGRSRLGGTSADDDTCSSPSAVHDDPPDPVGPRGARRRTSNPLHSTPPTPPHPPRTRGRSLYGRAAGVGSDPFPRHVATNAGTQGARGRGSPSRRGDDPVLGQPVEVPTGVPTGNHEVSEAPRNQHRGRDPERPGTRVWDHLGSHHWDRSRDHPTDDTQGPSGTRGGRDGVSRPFYPWHPYPSGSVGPVYVSRSVHQREPPYPWVKRSEESPNHTGSGKESGVG